MRTNAGLPVEAAGRDGWPFTHARNALSTDRPGQVMSEPAIAQAPGALSLGGGLFTIRSRSRSAQRS